MTNSNFENVQGRQNFRANNYERSNSRGKYGGNRDSGGFRIRLSDNEMKAVKAIQETFQLKSTVAVLGFSVRTLSEIIKDKELNNLISNYLQNNQNTANKFSSKSNTEENISEIPDPFARPMKSKKVEENNLVDKNIDEK